MTLPQEHWVIAEHKEQITAPHHYVPLHEHYHTCMVSHRAEFYITLNMKMFLYPDDEVTTISRAEDIQHHKHHPHAKTCRHNKVFWCRATQHLQLIMGKRVQRLTVYQELLTCYQSLTYCVVVWTTPEPWRSQ